jgi:hypothetical protein
MLLNLRSLDEVLILVEVNISFDETSTITFVEIISIAVVQVERVNFVSRATERVELARQLTFKTNFDSKQIEPIVMGI